MADITVNWERRLGFNSEDHGSASVKTKLSFPDKPFAMQSLCSLGKQLLGGIW
jgi:hypothetical protein